MGSRHYASVGAARWRWPSSAYERTDGGDRANGRPARGLRHRATARPDSPPASYGVPLEGGKFIAWRDVVERLRTATGYWLATVTPRGRPHVVPIWGVFVGDDLYLETGAPETIKNRNLAVHPEIAVHLDGVDDVVLVRGTATPAVPDPELGTALVAAFTSKYHGYEPGPTDWDHGGLVRVEPVTLLAWREMPTSSRWRFA